MNGEKDWCPLRDLTSEDVRGWLDLATTASGREFQHQSKHHHTLYPSVQGMWNSYVNTDPTVTQKQFPSVRKISICVHKRSIFIGCINTFPGRPLPWSALVQDGLRETSGDLREAAEAAAVARGRVSHILSWPQCGRGGQTQLNEAERGTMMSEGTCHLKLTVKQFLQLPQQSRLFKERIIRLCQP